MCGHTEQVWWDCRRSIHRVMGGDTSKLDLGCAWDLFVSEFSNLLFDFLSVNLYSSTIFQISPPYLHPCCPSIQHTFDPLIDHSGNLSLSSPSKMEHTLSFLIFYLSIPFEATLDVSFMHPPLRSSISSSASSSLSSLWVSSFICLLFQSKAPW